MVSMDRLSEHDLALSRQTPAATKLQQALQVMAAGIRIHRAVLQQARPEATEREIEESLEAWLAADG